MLISTLNCEMWPNFSYRGVRSVQLLLLLLLLMVFSSENFGFSPPYAGIAGIGPENIKQRRYCDASLEDRQLEGPLPPGECDVTRNLIHFTFYFTLYFTFLDIPTDNSKFRNIRSGCCPTYQCS